MQEQFSYSLMASGLGILIVFSILVLLSVLMILIRKLSDVDTNKKTPEQAQPAVSTGTASQVPLPVLVAVASAATGAGTNSPDWVSAAVAAYLASLDDDAVTPRAASWSSCSSGKYDPWVANNKLTKTAPGA